MSKQTWKELGIVIGACITIAIADRLMIVYFGYGISDIFSR
jgi:hypothetical protein